MIQVQSICEIAFGTPPLAQTAVWTDVSRYLSTYSTTSGRDHELKPTDPASATITLEGLGGVFDPANTTGPFAGGMTVGRRIRLRERYNRLQLTLAPGDLGPFGVVGGYSTGIPMAGYTGCNTGGGFLYDATFVPSLFVATTTGTISVNTPTGTLGCPVTPGDTLFGVASSAAVIGDSTNTPGATGAVRSFTVTMTFYNSAGAFISSATGSAVTEQTTPDPFADPQTWVQATTGNVTVPAGAAFASLTITYTGSAINDYHVVAQLGVQPMFTGSGIMPWTPGTRVVFDGFIETIVPTYTNGEQQSVTITAYDVVQRYNRIKSGTDSTYTAMVNAGAPSLWWRFGDPVLATSALDSSPSGAHGTYGRVGTGVAAQAPPATSLVQDSTDTARTFAASTATTSHNYVQYTGDLPGLAPYADSGGYSMPACTVSFLMRLGGTQGSGPIATCRLWAVLYNSASNVLQIQSSDGVIAAVSLTGVAASGQLVAVILQIAPGRCDAWVTANGTTAATGTVFGHPTLPANAYWKIGGGLTTGVLDGVVDEFAVMPGAPLSYIKQWAAANGTGFLTDLLYNYAAIVGGGIVPPGVVGSLNPFLTKVVAPKTLIDATSMTLGVQPTAVGPNLYWASDPTALPTAPGFTPVANIGTGGNEAAYVQGSHVLEYGTQTAINTVITTLAPGYGATTVQDASKVAAMQSVVAALTTLDVTFAASQARAQQIINNCNAAPQRLKQITLDATSGLAIYQALARQIGDCVKVSILTPDGRYLQQVSHIEGIARSRTTISEWNVTWKLSPAIVSATPGSWVPAMAQRARRLHRPIGRLARRRRGVLLVAPK